MVLYLSSQREPLRSKKVNIAGWSSLVARRAHNPKVVGSNPAPATTKQVEFSKFNLLFCVHIKVGCAAEVSMCLSCFYHTGFALEELEDFQGKTVIFAILHDFVCIASGRYRDGCPAKSVKLSHFIIRTFWQRPSFSVIL